MSTYTREEKKRYNLAGYVCKLCPSPHRPHDTEKMQEVGDLSKTKYITLNTKRCKECSRLMKRYQRGKDKVERLAIAKGKTRVSFVTLTMPNYVGIDPKVGVREMKKLVSSFRETDDFNRIVEGGYDFYEWTHNHDDDTWNIHSHSLWIMSYWPQKLFQKAWEKHLGIPKAIVHLRRTGDNWKDKKGHWHQGDADKDAMWYCMKYGGKDSVKGIRLSQGFLSCYGSAFAELESQHLAREELLAVPVVCEYHDQLASLVIKEQEESVRSIEREESLRKRLFWSISLCQSESQKDKMYQRYLRYSSSSNPPNIR